MSDKTKALVDALRGKVDVQMGEPVVLQRTPQDQHPDAGGWLYENLMRATQDELNQFQPPPPPGFLPEPSRVDVQMGAPVETGRVPMSAATLAKLLRGQHG